MKKFRRTAAVVSAAALLSTVIPCCVHAEADAENYSGMYGISSVTSSNMEDFEGFGEPGVEGVTLFTGTDTLKEYKLSDYITLNVQGVGNKAEIVKDSYSDSYALKLTHTGNGTVSLSNWFDINKKNLSETATAHAGYKARFEHYASNTWCQKFNAIVDNMDWYGIAKIQGYGDKLMLPIIKGGLMQFPEKNLQEYSEHYLKSDITYNSYNKIQYVTADGKKYENMGNNTHTMARAFFNITGATGAANGSYYGKGDPSKPTVIWLDDIYFETIDYKAKEITVGGFAYQNKELANVPIDAPINVKMSDYISDTYLNGTYMTLTDSKGETVDFDIERDTDSSFTVYPKNQKAAENYVFTVKAGINSGINSAIGTTADKKVTYTTSSDGLTFMGYIEDLDFDDIADTSFTRVGSGYILDGKFQIFTNQEGDGISVTTDPVTNSKALRLTRAAANLSGGMSKYNYVFNPVIDSGKITVSFDVRMTCNNGSAGSFISFSSDKATGSAQPWTNRFYNNYWWKKSDGSEQWTNAFAWDTNVYFPAMMSIDFTNNMFKGETYRYYGKENQQINTAEWSFERSEEKNTNNIGFMNLVDFRSAYKGSTTEDINIYIDNLKIAHYDYKKLQAVNVSKAENGADIGKEIVITMNDEVMDEYLSPEYFVVSDSDGVVLENYTVTKNGCDIIITLDSTLDFNSSYIVAVKKGIKSTDSMTRDMESDYMYSFNTQNQTTVELKNMNIVNGQKNVMTNKKIEFTFSEALTDSAVNAVTVKKGVQELIKGSDYTVELIGNKLVVSPTSVWEGDTSYNISVSELNAVSGALPYKGIAIDFTTIKAENYVLIDDFSEFSIGDKWAGPQTNLNIGGNIYVTLQAGDTLEYAYDEVTGKNGFKLIKGSGTDKLDFMYRFPQAYAVGKYSVKVDERIQNHSKAHCRWPALLDGTNNEFARLVLYNNTGAWVGQIGNSDNFISRHNSKDNVILESVVEPGESYRYVLNNQSKDTVASGTEYRTDVNTFGGLLFRMLGTNNNSNAAYMGTETDEDTVNNRDNNGISWIYGITVEKIMLEVTASSFEDNADAFDPNDSLTLTFNEPLDETSVNTDTIKLYIDSELIDSYSYSLMLSEDKKTVTLNPVVGLMYGKTYTIEISKDIRAKNAGIELLKNKSYTIKTADYIDTANPDIVWSSIPDNSENISVNTDEIILRTDVWLDNSTINKDNIKVYENGQEFDGYTVEAYGLNSIKVNFYGLNKEKTYKITVTGLKTNGDNALPMTVDYETSFTTRGDIYTDNLKSSISADGTKSVVTGELFNKSDSAVSYQVIGVLRAEDDSVLSIVFGNSGILDANEVCDITAEALVNETAAKFELYIWDGIGSMRPLVKKNNSIALNKRTYGYDNYIDSSKPLNISFIGGSITQQGQYTAPFTEKLTAMLKAENPERVIEYNVQGIGGTGSNLGLYRLEKDVISKNPDIVFIEFAVNDAKSPQKTETMEGMIRKLMKLDHQPMVILLNVTTEDHSSLSSVDAYKVLADTYDIGMVDVAHYLIDNEASQTNPDGLFVWKEGYKANYPSATALTTSDGVHPNSEGGRIYANYMYKLISENPEEYLKKMTYVKEPVSGVEYNNPRMVSWNRAIYDENWKVNPNMKWAFADGQAEAISEGASLTFKFTGTAIGLYMPVWNGATGASYSIDNGKYEGVVSGGNSGISSEMPMMKMINNKLSDGEHTITITVNKADNLNFKFGYFIID